MRAASRDLAILIGLSFPTLFLALDAAPAYRVHELRVLETAREMEESGDLLIPRFNGNERFEKPPLAYWLALGGFLLRGAPDELGGRLYSALAGALTALIVYAFGRSFGIPRVGLKAGLILLTSFLFFSNSRRAQTDILMTCMVTAAFYSFWRAFESGPRSFIRSQSWAALAWVAVGLAFLAKGPAGLLVTVIPLSIYLALARRWRGFGALFSPVGMVLGACVACPWFILVLERNRGAIEVFFREMDVAASGLTHGKANPLYATFFYFLRLWPDFFPWSPFFVVAAAQACRRLRTERAPAFLLSLCGGILLLLGFVGNKQPHYLLPAFPAMALLTAWWFEAEAPRLTSFPPPWPSRIFAVLAGAMVLVICIYASQGVDRGSEGKSCRDFAVAARPLVGRAPVYFQGAGVSALNFHLRRTIPLTRGRLPEITSRLDRKETLLLFLRSRRGEAGVSPPALPFDPRFRLVLSSSPPEVPLDLYQAP